MSSDEIQELKSVAVNKNTSRSTKQWMNVFQSWAKSRHLENVSIETASSLMKNNEAFFGSLLVLHPVGGSYRANTKKREVSTRNTSLCILEETAA